MKIITFLILMALNIITCGVGIAQDAHALKMTLPQENEFMSVVIPSLVLNDDTVSKVIEQVLQSMKEGTSYKGGLKGVIIASPQLMNAKVTMKARDIPFGYVLQMLADGFNCHLIVRDGYVIIAPYDLLQGGVTVVSLPFNSRVLQRLGLDASAGEPEVRAAFERFKIHLDEGDSTVHIDKPNHIMWVRASARETKLLASLFELFDRGLLLKDEK